MKKKTHTVTHTHINKLTCMHAHTHLTQSLRLSRLLCTCAIPSHKSLLRLYGADHHSLALSKQPKAAKLTHTCIIPNPMNLSHNHAAHRAFVVTGLTGYLLDANSKKLRQRRKNRKKKSAHAHTIMFRVVSSSNHELTNFLNEK